MNLHVRDGLNPQTRAADPTRSVFVTANAGSGKTTTLVSRVARLLLGGAAPSAILCVTYTKAAAAEMQARLFETLGKWAVMDDGELSAELARLDDSDPAALNPARLSEARRLFARALETPGGLKIQTIHAFCEKLLRRFPIEAGVSPRFTVLENEAAIALSHAAREDLARAALRDAEGPVGEAYSHFAVELDWGRFQDLLALIEAKRAELTDYVARVADGRAPGPYVLTGADPQKTPEDIEAGFMRWLDRGEVRRMAELMATGSKTDKDRAAELIHALDHDWSFHGLGVVFLTGSGSPRKSMATRQAPPDAAGWLADLQDKFLAARDQLRAAKVADDTIRLLTLANAHAALYEAAKTAHGALDFSDLVARTVETADRPLDRRLGAVQAGRRRRSRPDRRGPGHRPRTVGHHARPNRRVLHRGGDRPHRLRRRRREAVDLLLPGRPARAAAAGSAGLRRPDHRRGRRLRGRAAGDFLPLDRGGAVVRG
ncbi:DNA helicase II [Brevundimonas vancanneytii]|uniref:DNA 3'-5' helicase II n=1 Tax=Brevundimonas vancanneytii TaxID=1325724 RepID=A0A4P1JT90_9CAUL|nr:DNA helicase II [Brevundimonas vancanneytii]